MTWDNVWQIVFAVRTSIGGIVGFIVACVKFTSNIIAERLQKKHEALEIKAGVIEGNVATVEEVKALAELPSREGLLSMLLSVLQAPIRNLALATKAVADQKEEQGA